jgi:hypothetical protein
MTDAPKPKKSGIPLGEWSGSDATKALHETISALHETIRAYQKESSRQTAQMIRVTWAIAVLTFVMLIAVGAQIYLALPPARP